jgi:hypothetical protein
MLADGDLRYAKLLGAAPEAAMLDDVGEDFELAKCECRHGVPTTIRAVLSPDKECLSSPLQYTSA